MTQHEAEMMLMESDDLAEQLDTVVPFSIVEEGDLFVFGEERTNDQPVYRAVKGRDGLLAQCLSLPKSLPLAPGDKQVVTLVG